MAPQKMMLVVNRAGAPGLMPEQMGAELGRLPDIAIPDDPALVKATTAEGVPFVLAQPKSAVSQQMTAIVQRLTQQPGPGSARAAAAPSLAQSSS
jgi:MinD-like ATPase involved in chromosome partitioning or flagellar assembly